ncbi:MAG: MFS transporter [Candidatus Andeanibacterium colombiense]|uniref:MFS transporter n=1 Tax=Candidatus Andeanibacterium colombiense TaxID=3121345 RepID=A0AAJ5X455_9SPHN|nr:MAG: MFS transporter [Sphingomonadaceae bacterium]
MANGGEKTSEAGERAGGYAWYGLGVLVLVYMLNFIDRQILSILANDIKADLKLSDADLGFLYGTAFAIFYALFGVPLGRLADGWHRVRLLTLGLGLWSLMTVLSGFARNAAVLTFARVGVGVGEASATPAAYSLIADWFPARIRGTALGIYSAGLFVGSGLSLLLGGAIVEAWNGAYPGGGPLGLAGWQAAFIGVGLPGLALAMWVLTLREPVRGAIDGLPSTVDEHPWQIFAGQLFQLLPPLTVIEAARRGGRALTLNLTGAAAIGLIAFALARVTGNLQQFLFLGLGYYAVFSWACALRVRDPAAFALTWASPAFMGIVIAYGANCFVGYTVSYWAAPYAERVFAVDKAALGLLIGAPAAMGGFLGVIFGGRLADLLQDRFETGRIAVLAIALVLPIPIVLIGYSTADPMLFYILAFAVQFATSTALGAAAAASQALVLPRMRGVATAIFFLGTALFGLGLGPFTAGFVSEATGSLALGVKSTLLVAPIGLVAMALALRTAPAASRSLLERARVAGEPV